jgi:hypothetical protein
MQQNASVKRQPPVANPSPATAELESRAKIERQKELEMEQQKLWNEYLKEKEARKMREEEEKRKRFMEEQEKMRNRTIQVSNIIKHFLRVTDAMTY